MNQVADTESRTVRNHCDWMLHPGLFVLIQEVVGPVEIDLFASRLTHQLLRYYSWRPDPEAEATEMFTQNWNQLRGYANPPWCLLLATLAKIQRGSARVMLVASLWKTQPWYPLLLQLLSRFPLLIPIQDDIVISPTQGEFIMPAGGSTVGCLATIRHCGRTRGLSEGASMLLESAWRYKTKSTYELLFKRWDCRCKERGRNPIRGPLVDILFKVPEGSRQLIYQSNHNCLTHKLNSSS